MKREMSELQQTAEENSKQQNEYVKQKSQDIKDWNDTQKKYFASKDENTSFQSHLSYLLQADYCNKFLLLN